MTEQMNYATYGKRRRRVRPGDKNCQRGSPRGSMPNSEAVCSSHADSRVRRRKYTQTSRSKSPSRPSQIRSVSPPRRRPSRERTPERQRGELNHASSDRRPKFVRSKSLDERPRHLYQRKQKEFHRQMSAFDLSKDSPPPTGDNNKKSGKTFVKAAKLFFKDKLPGVPTISGNACKKYSEIMLSRFRSDSSAISYQCERENSANVTGIKLSTVEHSSDGNQSFVDREEVDMDEEDIESTRSHELESGFGSHADRLSSVTFSQYQHQNDEDFGDKDGDDSQDDNSNNDQTNKFAKELVFLLDENESLRGNINGLRRDFESMLKRMQMIADGGEVCDDEQSIQTDDNSRVSVCLRQIDEMKIQALDKFKKVAEKRLCDKNEEFAKKEKDIESFEECIEDLLCENERLFNNVVLLSKERETILKEVQCLRHEIKGKQDDVVNSAASLMLTDEREAKSQNSYLDKISVLLKKMRVSSKENADPTEVENDIISLVAKIMTQQHYLEKLNESELPTVPEGCEQQCSSRRAEGYDEQYSAVIDDDDKREADDDDYISGADDDSYISGADDDDYISGAEDDNHISGNSTCSDCKYDSSEYNEQCREEYHEVLSDSLLDNKSPPFFPNDREDDSSEALEVIYEYYSSASEASYYCEEDGYYPPRRSSYSTADYSDDIESAKYYLSERSRSTSRARSASASRARSASARRARSASRSRSLRRSNHSPPSSISSSSSQRSASFHSESIQKDDEKASRGQSRKQNNSHSQNPARDEEIANAIDSHLDTTVFHKPLRLRTLSTTCASISASESEDSTPTYLSFSSDSTKEQKAITITVVGRSSRHISFPSTREHTFVSFFTVSVRKHQVDAVLEEQLLRSKESLDSTSTLNASNVTCPQNNCSKKKKKSKKYKGELNDDGLRHGYGIYTSRNGNEYRGEWQNNKREGLGVVKVGNGDVFEGQFEGNLKNGIGVYHYQDGECDLSRYENDVRVGQSIRWSADRKQVFLLTEEPSVLKISLKEATAIAMKMGTVIAS